MRLMKPGSVIVDLAGEAGGSCLLSEPGQSVCERNHGRSTRPLKVSGRAQLAGRSDHASVRSGPNWCEPGGLSDASEELVPRAESLTTVIGSESILSKRLASVAAVFASQLRNARHCDCHR